MSRNTKGPPRSTRRASNSRPWRSRAGFKIATSLVGASLVGLAVFALAGNRGAARSPAGALPVASRADRLGTKLSSIPPHVFSAVGAGSAVAFPLQVAAPALTESGKPAVLYMGAEYCPYCATERWALVVALSRFGSFTGLHVIQSASDDAFPNTQTFTFHGSAYRSPYLAFDAVELETNQRAHGSYTKLDPPTPEQRRLMLTYDGPPFFNPSSTGGIRSSTSAVDTSCPALHSTRACYKASQPSR